jgi:hypothetical protein
MFFCPSPEFMVQEQSGCRKEREKNKEGLRRKGKRWVEKAC